MDDELSLTLRHLDDEAFTGTLFYSEGKRFEVDVHWRDKDVDYVFEQLIYEFTRPLGDYADDASD